MTAASPPAATLRALLDGLVDYAGLFPPAALEMPAAVRCYARYHAGAAAWMLGRLVVPAARLDEFTAAAAAYRGHGGARWRLSALVGPDTESDLARVAQFNAEAGVRGAAVDALEARAPGVAAIDGLAAVLAAGMTTYVELPATTPDFAPLVARLRRHRLCAKLRTGGVTADAFPAAAEIVRFLVACRDGGVGCKLTAGLHHPLPGAHPLTYDADSERAPMPGFVNVFMAALLLRDGLDPADAARLLGDEDPDAFAFDDAAARWRDHAVPLARIGDGRARFAASFGSCSFEEPLDALRALGWLPSLESVHA